jgi:hypothetical protein
MVGLVGFLVGGLGLLIAAIVAIVIAFSAGRPQAPLEVAIVPAPVTEAEPPPPVSHAAEDNNKE